jgi:hypothetical protein
MHNAEPTYKICRWQRAGTGAALVAESKWEKGEKREGGK